MHWMHFALVTVNQQSHCQWLSIPFFPLYIRVECESLFELNEVITLRLHQVSSDSIELNCTHRRIHSAHHSFISFSLSIFFSLYICFFFLSFFIVSHAIRTTCAMHCNKNAATSWTDATCYKKTFSVSVLDLDFKIKLFLEIIRLSFFTKIKVIKVYTYRYIILRLGYFFPSFSSSFSLLYSHAFELARTTII